MGIGMRELIVILLIALVLFGAKRLKTIGSDLGATLRGFKNAVRETEDVADTTSEPSREQGRIAAVASPDPQADRAGMKKEPSSASPSREG